jgi:Zn-dependent protease
MLRMLDLLNNPLIFLISFIGLILSLSFHEFAHAFTADKLGDPTPRSQGRVTLNPLAHLDPIGTIAMLITRFGWGKPVQFDPYNLKNPMRDSALIALAGPASNLVIATILSVILKLNLFSFPLLTFAMGQVAIINIVLAIFNLVPVYPLDGSKILMAVLPRQTAYEYELFMRQYGMFVLIALIFPWYNGASPISFLISPIIQFVASILL